MTKFVGINVEIRLHLSKGTLPHVKIEDKSLIYCKSFEQFNHRQLKNGQHTIHKTKVIYWNYLFNLTNVFRGYKIGKLGWSWLRNTLSTAQDIKFSIKDLFSKWDQICRKLRFAHTYWRNPSWKASFFVQCMWANFPQYYEEFSNTTIINH